MGIEQGSQFSQEEIDKIQTQRALSDTELIRGGAIFEKGILQPTGEQIDNIKKEMDQDLYLKTEKGQADIMAARSLNIYLQMLTNQIGMQGKIPAVEGMSEEDLKSFYEVANCRIGFKPEVCDKKVNNPATQSAKTLIEKNLDLFKGIFREARDFSLVGKDISVQRSDKRVERGWKIANYDKNSGFVRVEDNQRGLFKNVPLWELAMFNSTLFPATLKPETNPTKQEQGPAQLEQKGEIQKISADETRGALFLTKISTKGESRAPIGFQIAGALLNDSIELGKSINLVTGNTSRVERITRGENGVYIIETKGGSYLFEPKKSIQ